MVQVSLPFEIRQNPPHQEDLRECGFFRTLPPAMQKACEESPHLLEYLHMLPIEKIGVPEYFPKLSRKAGEIKRRNLLYPVSRDVLIHVWSGSGEERDLYVPVEPSLAANVDDILIKVEERLLDMASGFAHTEVREEREQALVAALSEICHVSEDGEVKTNGANGNGANGNGHGKGWLRGFWRSSSNGKVYVTPREFSFLKYLLLRDKVGMGVLEPLVMDPYIEDISCSGLGQVFIEHKIFKGMRSAIVFETHEQLDEFVLRLSERIKRPVTMRNPIVDAVLPDGSRINIVYGRDVSQRGSNFTIRKFSDTPLSIMELIEFGSLDYRMAAYISLVLEEGMNVFVSGETASGKTTLLNAMTTFVPPAAKVVSIEDTPEIQVPHPNWLREVAKTARRDEKAATITMMDLLKAALRQRPNLIIIGEIRGEEGAVAFQAMQTGHAVMATFHAATVQKLIQRLTGNPINIPKTYIDNLNLVVIQSAVKLANGKTARRALSISEIVGYDSSSDSFSFIEVFRWDPSADTFEFVGDKNSYLLEQKIAPKRGIPPDKKWEIYKLIEKRAIILRKLHKEKGITGYYELLKVISKAQQEGIF